MPWWVKINALSCHSSTSSGVSRTTVLILNAPLTFPASEMAVVLTFCLEAVDELEQLIHVLAGMHLVDCGPAGYRDVLKIVDE